ncbi:uncharacterized protein EKO05_0005423 [Ascochyta rabiei]|uniref:Uncharacterized protein n=1 Tax=Didymella rabiei TaxID=5454 RepID=A0A163JPR0_DIDRA|nr:uncharacterized protein EKO05_0005423 [Ascochyta rabiei]KZM26498.1 hypothetical protein ST47_g2282 [Ascochyta rabiei]UPX14953.1 hypothetical protein EKO05_0005423 [Ascochyta rabiei]
MEVQHYDPTVAHQELQPAEHRNGSQISTAEKEQSFLRMYSCLPWELRNYIHTYCVQGSRDNEVIVSHAIGSKPAFLVRQPISTHSYQWIEDPTLLHMSPDRIGRDAAREVLDAYYQTRTFKFAHRELGSLRTFLETDRFCLDMRPADHVRRVHLQIQPSLHAQLRDFESKDEEIGKCCQALGALAAVQTSRTTVTVHLDLAQDFFGSEEEERLVTDAAGFVFRIVEVIDNLRLKGLRIDLIFEGGLDKRTGLQFCNRTTTSLAGCTPQTGTACT